MNPRSAEVFFNNKYVGILSCEDGEYNFRYDDNYISDENAPPISLSFPKRKEAFTSPCLFPFFFGLLAEGENKEIQCTTLRLDENDHFSRLLATLISDSIGGITVREK
jgi:HipA-like protein